MHAVDSRLFKIIETFSTITIIDFFFPSYYPVGIYNFLLHTVLLIVVSTALVRKYTGLDNFACTVNSLVPCIKASALPAWNS